MLRTNESVKFMKSLAKTNILFFTTMHSPTQIVLHYVVTTKLEFSTVDSGDITVDPDLDIYQSVTSINYCWFNCI